MLLAGCEKKSATADLDRVLGVTSESLTKFENTSGNLNATDINKDNVISKFSESYEKDLNAVQPPLNAGPIGVKSEADGSLLGFDDKNNNKVKDEGEKDLFKMEVDSQNNRLVASSDGEVREQGFSGSGLLMGMLIGNMLSRQRATGANPASRRATPKRASKVKSNSFKSRSGSGSFSRGK
jgi:hypothetical protein